MDCFNHSGVAAIGTCKSCSKGLCSNCATDLNHGLACKNKHESQVEAMNMIIEKNAKMYAAAPKNTIIAPVFYLFMGLLFSGFGYFSNGGIVSLPFLMGLGFIIFAIVVFVRNRALFENS